MDIKEIINGHEKLKEISPEAYNESIKISIPFFMLHKSIFEEGENILTSKYKINQSELDVLGSLFYLSEENFTQSPTQLYEKLLFSSGGMTKILKKLEEKKLIKRVENKDDKRSKLVQITSRGKDITNKALKEMLEIEEGYYKKLSKEEQEKFKELLEKML